MSEAVLSPRELAQAIGVSESSLKRWADEGRLTVSRTAGGHRRILLSDAIRFIRESHATVVRPELLGMSEIAPVASQMRLGTVGDPATVLYDALVTGDGPRTRGIILSWFLDGQPLPTLFDGPIRLAMHRMGELWKHADEGIYLEHRATDLCIQSLQHLRSLLPAALPDAPVAIGGARATDPYLLPALMCSIILTDLGWRTVHLGSDCPANVLLGAANAHQARLVYFSATSQVDPKVLTAEVKSLAADLATLPCQLVVGGQQFDSPPLIITQSNIHTGHSMNELAAFARGLQNGAQ